MSTLTFRRRIIIFGKILVRSPTDIFFAGEPFASKMFKLTAELLASSYLYIFVPFQEAARGEECDIINRTKLAKFSRKIKLFGHQLEIKIFKCNFEKLRSFIC